MPPALLQTRFTFSTVVTHQFSSLFCTASNYDNSLFLKLFHPLPPSNLLPEDSSCCSYAERTHAAAAAAPLVSQHLLQRLRLPCFSSLLNFRSSRIDCSRHGKHSKPCSHKDILTAAARSCSSIQLTCHHSSSSSSSQRQIPSLNRPAVIHITPQHFACLLYRLLRSGPGSSSSCNGRRRRPFKTAARTQHSANQPAAVVPVAVDPSAVQRITAARGVRTGGQLGAATTGSSSPAAEQPIAAARPATAPRRQLVTGMQATAAAATNREAAAQLITTSTFQKEVDTHAPAAAADTTKVSVFLNSRLGTNAEKHIHCLQEEAAQQQQQKQQQQQTYQKELEQYQQSTEKEQQKRQTQQTDVQQHTLLRGHHRARRRDSGLLSCCCESPAAQERSSRSSAGAVTALREQPHVLRSEDCIRNRGRSSSTNWSSSKSWSSSSWRWRWSSSSSSSRRACKHPETVRKSASNRVSKGSRSFVRGMRGCSRRLKVDSSSRSSMMAGTRETSDSSCFLPTRRAEEEDVRSELSTAAELLPCNMPTGVAASAAAAETRCRQCDKCDCNAEDARVNCTDGEHPTAAAPAFPSAATTSPSAAKASSLPVENASGGQPCAAAPSQAPSLLVVAGPSGVGKGTLVKRVLQQWPHKVCFSVSHTTRAPRPGEQHGREYYFCTEEEFAALKRDGGFLESATFSGASYGTSVAAVKSIQSKGCICLLEIDLEGVRQVQESALAKQARFVFIQPPSLAELERRLRGRKTETEERIQTRLAIAERELSLAEKLRFDRRIVNDNLEEAWGCMHDELLSWFDPRLQQEQQQSPQQQPRVSQQPRETQAQ